MEKLKVYVSSLQKLKSSFLVFFARILILLFGFIYTLIGNRFNYLNNLYDVLNLILLFIVLILMLAFLINVNMLLSKQSILIAKDTISILDNKELIKVYTYDEIVVISFGLEDGMFLLEINTKNGNTIDIKIVVNNNIKYIFGSTLLYRSNLIKTYQIFKDTIDGNLLLKEKINIKSILEVENKLKIN